MYIPPMLNLIAEVGGPGAVLAAGFVTPAFAVAGVLAVSIPIIIHILNRRRFKIVDWAAMQFILAAMRKNRRRLQFEQWLLLATRCALLALLGLALARPLGCGNNALGRLAGGATSLHIIVLDNSYSMAYEADRNGAKTQFDQAKKLAIDLIGTLSSGNESVVLLTASSPAEAPIATPTYDLQAAVTAVQRVTQRNTGTDLAGALQLAEQVAADSRQPNKVLDIITDGTASAWQGTGMKSLQTLGPKLAADLKIRHYNLAVANQTNAAVLDLSPASNLVRTRFANDFRAKIASYGATLEEPLLWKLADQNLPASSAVKFDAEGTIVTQSNMQLQAGGPTVVTATLTGDDRLHVDNSRYVTVDVASEMKVLIVEGRRGNGPLDGSGAFLNFALAPPTVDAQPGRSTLSYIKPDRISDIELGGKVLGDYRAILMTDVQQVPPTIADALVTYVKDGGTVVWFMGEQVSSEAYNSVLVERNLLPGPLVQRQATGKVVFDFNPGGNNHPLLKAFKNIDKSGLSTAQIFTYWQVAPRDEAKIERVLNFVPAESKEPETGGAGAGADKSPAERPADAPPPASAGDGSTAATDLARASATATRPDPAVTVQSLGGGRIVFFATSADAEWTSFPAKPAYVTLMHEIVAGSVAGSERWMNIPTGGRVEIPISQRLAGVPKLRDPAKTTERTLDQVRRPDGVMIYQSEPVEQPGVYYLTIGTRTVPISVNVPADEADIRPLNDAAIQAALGGIDMQLLGPDLPSQSGGGDDDNDFGWSIMAIVLVLLGVECLMAMRFGHYGHAKKGVT